MTVRSPVSRGRIRGLHFDAGFDWSGCVVVDHRDIPGPDEEVGDFHWPQSMPALCACRASGGEQIQVGALGFEPRTLRV